ncbi:Olfactory receptor 4S1 [Bienertia sinuspersici]
METRFNRFDRNYENATGCDDTLPIFSHPGRGLGAPTIRHLEKRELKIFFINYEINQFLFLFYRQYSTAQASHNLVQSEEEWTENFKNWFKNEAALLYENNKSKEMEHLLSLSRGPTQYVTSYTGYIVNGYRFRIESRDQTLRTQNSGVVVIGNTGNEHENIDYYGVITDILELQYLGGNRIVLFRCKWWDVYDKVRGVKTDEYGTVTVNCNRQLKGDEPFILASQARQAFYVTDIINRGWKVVSKTQPRNFCDTSDDDNIGCDKGDAYQHGELFKPTYVSSSSTRASAELCRSRPGVESIFVKDNVNKNGEQGPRKRRNDHNRVRPNMHTSQPTLPRSNRQYVPPLMLARGRGKKLSELHTSKTKVSANLILALNLILV